MLENKSEDILLLVFYSCASLLLGPMIVYRYRFKGIKRSRRWNFVTVYTPIVFHYLLQNERHRMHGGEAVFDWSLCSLLVDLPQSPSLQPGFPFRHKRMWVRRDRVKSCREKKIKTPKVTRFTSVELYSFLLSPPKRSYHKGKWKGRGWNQKERKILLPLLLPFFIEWNTF